MEEAFLFGTLIVSGVTALAALLLASVTPSVKVVHGVGGIGAFLGLLFMGLFLLLAGNGIRFFLGGLLALDDAARVFLWALLAVSVLVVLSSPFFLERERQRGELTIRKLGWYYFWLNLLLAAMDLAILFQHIGLTWVFIEATTLLSVPLVGLYGKRQSIEAAWKYMVLASLGILLALAGIIVLSIAILKVAHGGEITLNLQELLEIGKELDPRLLKIAFILFLVGYGTKAGIAPLHTWLPDAYGQAPSPVSALLSGALSSCSLLALMRVTNVISLAVPASFLSPFFIGLGLFSLVLVLPFLFQQHDFKRLLSYSSVEHMGILFLIFGLGSVSMTTALAVHLVGHAILKALLFILGGEVMSIYQSRTIRNIRGLLRIHPLIGGGFLLTFLGLLGLPPFPLFLSEFLMIRSAFFGGQYLVGIGTLLLLILLFAATFPQVLKMVFGKPEEIQEKYGALAEEPQLSRILPVMLMVVAFIVLLGTSFTASSLVHQFLFVLGASHP